MSTDQMRVVVTGLGAISPVGADVATTWKSLLAGHSGVVQLTDSWAAELPARIVARAAADPAALLDRVQARRMDRCSSSRSLPPARPGRTRELRKWILDGSEW